MKKKLKFIALSLCIFTLFSFNAEAAEHQQTSLMEPYYSNIQRANVNLAKISSGINIDISVLSTRIGKISISAYLQRYTNGNWVNIKSWYTSKNSATHLVFSKKYTPTRNHKYRISTTIKCNNEQIKKYSNVISY